MTEVDIEKMKKEIMKDTEEQQKQEAEVAAAAGGGAPGAAPGPMEAGGQEGAENVPPTAAVESVINNLEGIKDNSLLEEDKIAVVDRIIKKQKDKIEKVSN